MSLYSFKRLFWLKHLFWKLPVFAVDEVHVEKVEDDKCYDKLCEWCRKHPDVMLMLTVKKGFRNKELVKSRYKDLSNPKGLHTHIAIEPEIDEVPYEKQLEITQHGVDFLKECGIDAKDVTFGWFSFNEDTVHVCKELGLRLHIWYGQEWKVNLPIETIRVKKVLHDWELVGDIR